MLPRELFLVVTSDIHIINENTLYAYTGKISIFSFQSRSKSKSGQPAVFKQEPAGRYQYITNEDAE